MNGCINSVENLTFDKNLKTFDRAIDMWEYLEKHDFVGEVSFNMPYDERVKFSRWCMGNRCTNNKQEYTPI